jgi:threonine dehydratase
MSVSLDDIRHAAEAIRGAVARTPIVAAPRLSAVTGVDLLLKLENLQRTGSFKTRGALVRMLRLDADARRRGVIAMSAGNHAQAVAYHGQRLGIPATIVMPKLTPFTKIENTSAYGARVILEGDGLAEAAEYAKQLGERETLTFIHPYDDVSIIAGQGTVGLELVDDAPDIDTVVVPVGGGGLSAGVGVAVKSLRPQVRLVGVQASLFPDMVRRLRPETRLANEPGDRARSTLAEGIAVKRPGEMTCEILRRHFDDFILVNEAGIENAVHMLLTEEKILAEGAGAAPLAAVLAAPKRFAGRRVALIVSGGNIDPRIVASILMRGLAAAGHMARLRVEITDAPGMLARVASAIAKAGGNIVEIYHQRLFRDVPVTRADLDVIVETRNSRHLREIVAGLEAAGLSVRQLGNTAAEGPSPG